MFYSHEILTSRKHGVATVWLVATLGAKSTMKKVSKRAICDVNVPKACDIVINPEAPMALRLQSSLLYGVIRVYDRQCGYVLVDTQQLQHHMLQILKKAGSAENELDLEPGQTRREQLLLPDDPNFLPELAMATLDFDLGTLNMDFLTTDEGTSRSSNLLSATGSRSSQTSRGSSPRIRIPTSAKAGLGAVGDFGDFSFGADDDTSNHGGRISSIARRALKERIEADDLLPEVDFAFDPDGGIYDIDLQATRASEAREAEGQERIPSDASALERTIQERQDRHLALQRQAEEYNDEPAPIMGEDFAELPEAEPFPQRPRRAASQLATHRLSSSAHSQQPTSEEQEGSEYATAPQRRRQPTVRILEPDVRTTVSSQDIRDWTKNYRENMQRASAVKTYSKTITLAKHNANFWIWGQGLGGHGRQAEKLGSNDPMATFYGSTLRHAILGIRQEAGQKRDRASLGENDSEDSARRVRRRDSQEPEGGRGVQVEENPRMEEDNMGLTYEDEQEPEVGRHAPTPLAEDGSTIMPWNVSASNRSSAIFPQQRHSSRAATIPGSRLTSASPLQRRGLAGLLPSIPPQVLPPPGLLAAGGADPSSVSNIAGGFEVPYTPTHRAQSTIDLRADNTEMRPSSSTAVQEPLRDDSQYQLYGPAAYVDTQLADTGDWLQLTLDTEADNFQAFVENKIQGRLEEAFASRGREHVDIVRTACVCFHELLEPKRNSKIVAAQGFLHCLTLATRGVLRVEQEGKEILLAMEGVSAGQWRARVMSEGDGRGANDESEGEMGRHFREAMDRE